MKAHYAGWLLAGALALNIIPLQAADITITVNGKVVAKPCTVSTTNASVDLGDLYTFSPVSAGSASAPAQHRAGFKQLPGRHVTRRRHL